MDDFYISPGKKPGRRPGWLQRPWGGIAVFLLAVVMMLFVAAPVQYALGMWGLAITEVMLLALAVAAALAGGAGLGEVFPLAMPTGRQVLATLVTWAGYLGLALGATMAVAYFFPDEIFGTGQGMGELFSTLPLWLALVIVAVMPAICEEALFRGYIQHTFRGANRWVAATVVALLFGLMHLDPYRLLTTAILGFGLCFLRHKSRNMALPMIMHLVNNAFSTLSGYQSGSVQAVGEALPGVSRAILPATAFLCALGAPAAIFVGSLLLEPRRPLGQRKGFGDKKRQVIVVIIATALLFAGLIASLGPVMEGIPSAEGFFLAALPFLG